MLAVHEFLMLIISAKRPEVSLPAISLVPDGIAFAIRLGEARHMPFDRFRSFPQVFSGMPIVASLLLWRDSCLSLFRETTPTTDEVPSASRPSRCPSEQRVTSTTKTGSGAREAQKAAQHLPAASRTESNEGDGNADGEAGYASPCGSLRDTANLSSGGAGNRTPVPKHFRAGIYVCSPSIPAIHPLRGYHAFVGPGSDRLDSGTTIGQIFLAGTAAEAGRVVSPTLEFPRA